jgi:hypothetical protein
MLTANAIHSHVRTGWQELSVTVQRIDPSCRRAVPKYMLLLPLCQHKRAAAAQLLLVRAA